jgi:glyoxylase-like metal-dependent hydrolase (beta-lactamase superfamily II)
MNIHTIRMGITRCYIIQDKATIMVDSGPPNKLDNFTKSIQKAGIDPKQINLIINTHGHFDHIGSAKDIQNVTNAQIAMHELDKECLENSANRSIKGVNTWGRILAWLSARYVLPPVSTTEVDIILRNEEFSLVPFGISGKVLYTPGHTMGSVSVLLDTGDAFVGDLAMNGIPFHMGSGLTIFAEDLDRVKRSWSLLLNQGAKVIYPGHGNPFRTDMISRII